TVSTQSPNDTYTPTAWLLDGRGGARRLNAHELTAWRPSDGVLWICLADSSERDHAWLEADRGLDSDQRAAFLRSRPGGGSPPDTRARLGRGARTQLGASFLDRADAHHHHGRVSPTGTAAHSGRPCGRPWAAKRR